jgi:putative addiction module component (TIGR02574 family)
LPLAGVGGRLDAMASSLLDEIQKLSLVERIQLVEDIWDSIAAEREEFPIPESHRAELARRREEHRQSPEDVVPWEEVRRQLLAEE